MEKRIDISRSILDSFLERWPGHKIQEMTLEEYVGIKNPDTFCQWIETKTRELGSIKGTPSDKFGIYKRGDSSKRPKNLINDSQYSWQPFYGKTKDKAFRNIRKEILQIIQFAETGKFHEIDNLHLKKHFRWKIAYLYSNERLIPIFKKEVLNKIAAHFGHQIDHKTSISEIQKIIIKHKPANQNIYEYTDYLWCKFGRDKKQQRKSNKTRRRERKATTGGKDVQPQKRTGHRSYIASQKHNLLQEALKKKLIVKFGKGSVKVEENYVDVKLITPSSITFYEVKSASYASDCIKDALGQLLSYAFSDSEKKKKKIVVVGQYPPNENELMFIEFIKEILDIEFNYEHIGLDD